MSKPIRFHIRCDPKRRDYYKVFVFETEEEMYEHFRRTNVHTRWQRSVGRMDFAAICQSYIRYDVRAGRQTRKADVGQILLWAGSVSAGTVSHEMTHAVVYWLDKHTRVDVSRIADSPKVDERMAWVQGNLVSQFWRKFYRAAEGVKWATDAVSGRSE